MEDNLFKIAERTADKLGVGYFEIRISKVKTTSVLIQNDQLDELSNNVEMGIGVRAFKKGWGFSSANDLSKAEEVIKTAMKMAGLSRGPEKIYLGDPIRDSVSNLGEKRLDDVDISEKLEVTGKAAELLRGENVKNRIAGYGESIIETLYLNSLGSEIRTVTSRVRLRIASTAFEGGKTGEYWKSFGGTGGWELIERIELERWADFVSRKARELLRAKAPPSGKFEVIMDPELTGVFIHEAVGHAAEADAVKNGESIFAGRLGEKIGAEELNVVDDPTLPGKFGSYAYDDEGLPGKRVEIIKNGVLNEYLNDRETSALLNLIPNGHGRAQSYAHQPLVRMSNTFIEAGTWEPEEIFEEVKYGLYMIGDKGGEVDVATGTFTFGAKEGYIVENGELKVHLRDVSLSGNLVEVLRSIKAIGRDVKIHFPGYCGKGQWVPVDDGGPHVLTEALVGGR
ncbi:TldD/PmbA family protein [Thermococcus gammatolerans]|uniref:Peptidase U62, modulator of DNA gyrase, PmbA/TldD protein-like protein (TldD/pmbA) n=1 Tax=Thermococcus gammatolerans (strain DSM 15229 / JCM 11827 / EJ3) TaxID=593117 RepID=C5A2I9_THEGJ|nr:TldD/PmbA family protein [Thermococcus gammatolerans]ACS34608.1 Peptidase U62, modulator of DNA gyrase, PmbA/TldD protein-like protein (tldD/pmbA) [Thermococcus gammatolerans EJ3]